MRPCKFKVHRINDSHATAICILVLAYFMKKARPKEAGRCYFVQYSMYAAVLFSTASLSCIQALAMSA